MQFMTYFFASTISFLGLLIGIILINIAPEEQKLLSKYFGRARKIILLLIFIFLLFYFYNNIFYLSILLAYLAFAAFIEYRIHDLLGKSMIFYILLGILFYLGRNNIHLFTIESSLILLYGVSTASMVYSTKEKSHFKLLFYNMGFLIIANNLFFI